MAHMGRYAEGTQGVGVRGMNFPGAAGIKVFINAVRVNLYLNYLSSVHI